MECGLVVLYRIFTNVDASVVEGKDENNCCILIVVMEVLDFE